MKIHIAFRCALCVAALVEVCLHPVDRMPDFETEPPRAARTVDQQLVTVSGFDSRGFAGSLAAQVPAPRYMASGIQFIAP